MKIKLWRLIGFYVDQRIDEANFCRVFFSLYLHEINYDDFDEEEQEILSELSEVAGRFSPYEEDLKEMPNFFYDKNQLAAKILETKQKLMKIYPEYFEEDRR